jgi:hypothetical protein
MEDAPLFDHVHFPADWAECLSKEAAVASFFSSLLGEIMFALVAEQKRLGGAS